MFDASRVRRAALAHVLCGLAVLSLPSLANAAGEYEQNDTIQAAYGPLSGGTDYTGTIETANDSDWFVFYVKTYSQLDISATSIGNSCVGEWGELILYDKDGKFIDDLEPGYVNSTNHLRLTMNPGRYYLLMDTPYSYCVTRQYRFRIEPAAALTPSRVCGEAIVSRETVGPELAALNTKIATNGEALAKAEALFNARKAALKKLKNRPRVPRWKKRRAREKLLEAKAKKEKIEIARIGLQTLGAQQTTALNQANGLIATSC